MRGVDVVVHAAALKQVPACEYNPFEAVQTNVIGAENVVAAAIENDVPLTHRALAPTRPSTRSTSTARRSSAPRRSSTQGNAYAGDSRRPLRERPLRQRRRQPRQRHPALQGAGADRRAHDHRRAHDPLLDHARAGRRLRASTRLGRMGGGEIFVPKIPSMRVTDIAEALAPDAERRVIGIRPGEKLHEVLLTEDESRHALEVDDGYVDPARARVVAAARGRGRQPLAGRLPLLERHERRLARRRRAARDGRRRRGPSHDADDLPPVRPPGDLRRRTSRRSPRRCASRLITQGPTVERFERAIAELRRRASRRRLRERHRGAARRRLRRRARPGRRGRSRRR